MSSIERMVEKLKSSSPNGAEQRKTVERKPAGRTPPVSGDAAKQREAGFIDIDMRKLESVGFIAPPKDRAKLDRRISSNQAAVVEQRFWQECGCC